MEDLDLCLPDEFGGQTNGKSADLASGSSTKLQQTFQSNVSLSNGASSSFNSSAISTTVSVCSPNSPSLTATLSSIKSLAVNNSLSSLPQMPVSTSGTPTPATPLTSSSDLHLRSVGLSPTQSSFMPLPTMNNSLDVDMPANNTRMMGSMNGPSSATQSIALNTMAHGFGSNSGSNPFQNSLPQLQQDQLAEDGSPDQSRVSFDQVSFDCMYVLASALIFHGCQAQ